MLKRLATMCALVVIGTPSAAEPIGRQEPVTAFVNVSVIPMDRERVLTGQTVLVRGGRIAAVGPANKVKVPSGAVRVDGQGKFLIPGLGDMHTHVHVHAPRTPAVDTLMMEHMLFLYLANGVTTIRNMQETPRSLRERVAAGKVLSPHIYTSGHKLFDIPTTSSGNDTLVSILNPKDAAAVVAREKAEGYDFLKLYTLTGETFDSVIAAAKRIGIPYAGHVATGLPIERALEVGYRSIEHLSGYLDVKLDDAKIRELAAATKRAGVWNAPTYVVYENMQTDPDSLEAQPAMRYIAEERLSMWREESFFRGQTAEQLELRRKLIKALHDAGAGLLLATDSPAVYTIPGFSIHQELAAMVQSGLTPYQALETGTRNIAEFFGTQNSTGTVTVGKRADLVLLNGNPLVNIANTAEPAGVMVGGRWVPRKEIDARLVSVEKDIS